MTVDSDVRVASPTAIRVVYPATYLIPVVVLTVPFIRFGFALAIWVVVAGIVWLRARKIGLAIEGDEVTVTNFWKAYRLRRSEIRSVEQVWFPPTIAMPSAGSDCPALRLKNRERVLVVAGTGGNKKVNALLESLNVPFERDHRVGIKALAKLVRRKRRNESDHD